LQIENGNLDAGDTNSDCNGTDCLSDDKAVVGEEDAETTPPKPKSAATKEKKLKKSASPKISPKGKQGPKSKKETKSELRGEVEAANKEKEKLQSKKVESELKSQELVPMPDLQPTGQITQLISPLIETSETNESVVEVPCQDESTSHVGTPSASTEESSFKSLDTHSVKGSPRRSSRLATHLSLPKQRSPAKPDSSSVIVLDSDDDNISVLEVSQKFQDKSFAQTLRSLSGRPSLRPLPAYNRSFNRPSTVGSASVRSNLSSRSWTTGNDSESDSQEAKVLQSGRGLWGLFRTSNQNKDYTTDNEESTNRSLADDSGNDSEATNDPLEATSSLGFGKRKCHDAGFAEEPEQENKRIRGDGQRNNANISAGLLSIVSSPMNLFASKIRGEKGKSSTPVQVLEATAVDEVATHQDDVSEIQYEDENPNYLSEKESPGAILSEVEDEEEGAPRRWCSIM
jgi:hypothetical protein